MTHLTNVIMSINTFTCICNRLQCVCLFTGRFIFVPLCSNFLLSLFKIFEVELFFVVVKNYICDSRTNGLYDKYGGVCVCECE